MAVKMTAKGEEQGRPKTKTNMALEISYVTSNQVLNFWQPFTPVRTIQTVLIFQTISSLYW